MIQIQNYKIEELVAEKSEVHVYRAKHMDEDRSVILKSNREETATPRNLARLSHEFEVTRELNSAGVIKPVRIEKHTNGIALVFEDYQGRPLSQLIAEGELNLDLFLRIAINLAQTLGEIHGQNVIHKDIKPENIVIDPEGRARIIDFGISERINLKNRHLGNPDVLEGTLAYISPEQTGRMNRVLDYRSDLYSLGVTYYQMLTGRLPFETRDSMELVYSHIAHLPPPVVDRNPEIPAVLSQIVERLMAKNAEDRYQSAFGLKHDLEECLRRLDDGRIEEFTTGKRDYSGQFQISEKLYGRETQLATLLEAFDRVGAGGCELMLVAGYSGVGKSALVYEIHKPVTAKRAFFISGKYDQFQKNIPYFAIQQALTEFVQLLLTEPPERLVQWKDKILDAVGENGQLLIDLVPVLEHVIGPQPEVIQLGAQESQNRFNLVFQSFVRSISRQDHPLVLFIDDLQWADSASLALLRTLMNDPDNGYFLLIGAYRDNEVGPGHPFIHTLEEIRAKQAVIHEITLPNLSPVDTGNLLADALFADPATVNELTELVYARTQGNAFFTTEFLKELYENRKLTFDFTSNNWSWDLTAIAELNITDNVVDLMARRMERLDEKTRDVLHLAACIGNKFFLNILSIIHEASAEESLNDLWPAVAESMVLPLNDNYKLLSRSGAGHTPVDLAELKAGFRFGHDRIQQAAYNLVAADHRTETHLKIARLLDSHTNEEELDSRLFDIVNQYNLALKLLRDEEEILRVLRLTLLAAEKAIKSSAFASALDYLNSLMPYIKEEMWQSHQELLWSIYHRKAQAEYSCTQFEECDATLRTGLAHSAHEDQKVPLYQIHLENLFSMNRHAEGMEVAYEALAYLGVRLPKKVNKLHIGLIFARLRRKIGRRPAAEFFDLPNIEDRRQYNIVAICCDTVPSSYIVHSDTMGYVSLLMAGICIEYGNSRYSSFAYAMLSLMICSLTKEYRRGFEFAELALSMLDKYPDTEMKTRTYFLIANFSMHWVRSMPAHIPYIKGAVQFGTEVGSLNWINYAVIFSRSQSYFYFPGTLAEVQQENLDYLKILIKNNDPETIQNQRFMLNFSDHLAGSSVMADFDLEEYSEEIKKAPSILVRGYFHIFSMTRSYYLDDPENALRHAWESMKIIHELLSNLCEHVQRFYFCLVYLRYGDRLTGLARIKFRAAYRLNRWFLKHTARNQAENFEAHYKLVLAEEARAEGRVEEAAALFDKAIEAAETSGLPQNLCLAYELAGRAYAGWNAFRPAEALLKKAYRHYERWGYHAVSQRMTRSHPGIRLTMESAAETISSRDHQRDSSSSGTTTAVLLDIESVLKAARTISGEIHLDNLLRSMLEIVCENAGAKSASLFLTEEEGLVLQARVNESGEIQTMQALPASETYAPMAILNYVRRTGDAVVLSDALDQDQFTRSEYIEKHRPHSVLAAPINRQGTLTGILYLENNLVTGAFTPDRLQILNLLSSQLAVSLENALLYSSLEQKVDERTVELRASKKETDDIMANVRQGILTLDRDGRIGQEYSRQANLIFERDDLGGMPFTGLFEDEELHDRVKTYLSELFDNSFMSEQMFVMSNPLREREHTLPGGQNKMLGFNFSRIFQDAANESDADNEKQNGAAGAAGVNQADPVVEKIMVVVEDRSAEYILQQELRAKAEEQARRVEKLYQILNLEPRIFTQFIREASETLAEVRPRLEQLGGDSDRDLRIMEECFRAVHTLKGNARALNLDSIATRAHALEDELDVMRRNISDLSREFIERALQAVQDFSVEIQDGNNIFEKILNMKNALQDQASDPLRDFENAVRQVIKAEGAATGKNIDLMFRSSLERDEPKLEQVLHLKNAFIQLVRNSIDHGIESTEERAERGKPERGQIRVELGREEDGSIIISCEDDGRGLEIEGIKKRALAGGLYTADELDSMPNARLYKLIFVSGLTTAASVTQTSGRGVGMDIVREEVKRAGAQLTIRSQPGRSTKFVIRLPVSG